MLAKQKITTTRALENRHAHSTKNSNSAHRYHDGDHLRQKHAVARNANNAYTFTDECTMLSERTMMNGSDDGRCMDGDADHPGEIDDSCSQNVSVAPFLIACLLTPLIQWVIYLSHTSADASVCQFRGLVSLTGILRMHEVSARDL